MAASSSPPVSGPTDRPVRTRFAGLHGLAVADDRLARLAASLALPVCGEADRLEPLLAVLDGPVAADRPAVWLRPFAAWIEPDVAKETGDEEAGEALLPLAARAGIWDLYINLTTATANELHLAGRILTALDSRSPLAPERRDDLELALHEAVSNALVHGNLQVIGMKELSATELERFSRDLVARLGDPALAHRRLEIAVLLEPGAAVIEVTDEGAGFVPVPQVGQGASGRGLELITTIAESVELEDGGRRIRMRFPL